MTDKVSFPSGSFPELSYHEGGFRPSYDYLGEVYDAAPGSPAHGYYPGQDGDFPFQYSPGDDLYVGYRWDHMENGNITPYLTPEFVSSLSGLYMTNQTLSYASPWLEKQCRFTEILFEKPKYIQFIPQGGYHPPLSSVVESTGFHKTLDYSLENRVRVGAPKHLVEMGIHGFIGHDYRNDLEMFLVNPGHYIRGVRWRDFKPGEFKEIYNNRLCSEAIRNIKQLDVGYNSFFF